MDAEDDPVGSAPDKEWSGPRRGMFRFPQVVQLADVPRVEDGPRATQASIDQFLSFHPRFTREAAEEQLWDLADDMLGAFEGRVATSRGQNGQWALSSRRGDLSGYSFKLSPDGARIIAYSTSHLRLTYQEVKWNRVESERRRAQEVEAAKRRKERLRERLREQQEEREKTWQPQRISAALRALGEAERERLRQRISAALRVLGETGRQLRRAEHERRQRGEQAAKAQAKEVRAAKLAARAKGRSKESSPVGITAHRARALARAVMSGQIDEEEGRRRATRKGCKNEFNAELRSARREARRGRQGGDDSCADAK